MTQLMPLVVVALVLGSSTIVADAQSRGGGSASTGIGAIAAPPSSTTLARPAISLRSVGVITAPPSATTTSPAPVIGRPLNQLNLGNAPLNQGATFLATPVGPLPPVPTTETTLTTGGSSGVLLQGGGLDTLEACIGFWDRLTHMTKAEWKVACQRSLAHREEIQKAYQKR
jgi:hypothetical protein